MVVRVFKACLYQGFFTKHRLTDRLARSLNGLFVRFTRAALANMKFSSHLRHLFQRLRFSFQRAIGLRLLQGWVANDSFCLLLRSVAARLSRLRAIRRQLKGHIRVVNDYSGRGFTRVVVCVRVVVVRYVILLQVRRLGRHEDKVTLRVVHCLISLIGSGREI